MTRRLFQALAAACVLFVTLAAVGVADAAVVWNVKRIGDSAQGLLSIDRGLAAWDSFDGVRVWRASTRKTVLAPGTGKAIVSDVIVSGGQVFWLETVGDYWTGRGVIHVWRVGERSARTLVSRPHIQRGSVRVAGRRLCWSEAVVTAPFSRWRTRTFDDSRVQPIPSLADGSADLSLAENALAFGTLDWTRSVAVVPLGLAGADRSSALAAPKVIARAPSVLYLQGTLAAAGGRVAWAAKTPDNTATIQVYSVGQSAPRQAGVSPATGQAIALSQNRVAWVNTSEAGTQTIMSWVPGASDAATVAVYSAPAQCYGVQSADRRLIWFASSSATSTLHSWEADLGQVSTIPVTISRGAADLSQDLVVVVGETGPGNTTVSIARPVQVSGQPVAPVTPPWWVTQSWLVAVGVGIIGAGLVALVLMLVRRLLGG